MRIGIVITLSLFLSSCGVAFQKDSLLKVTNGQVISENDYPAVRQLLRHKGSNSYICTGTFVSDNTVLTAAHCLDTWYPRNNSLASTGQAALHAWHHPNYEGDVGGTDLGVLIFPDGTSNDFVPLRTSLPEIGDTFTIVGYGNNEVYTTWHWFWGTKIKGSGAGIKRKGTNRISGLDHGMIRFRGVAGQTNGVNVGTKVLSASGDSGGPLFIDHALAGITSGGWTDISSYVDLTSQDTQEFLVFARRKGARFVTTTNLQLTTSQSVQFDHWEGDTGYWQWTITLNGDLPKVACVVYHLDSTFPDETIKTCDRQNSFAMNQVGYDGLIVSIDVELVDGGKMYTQHELVL